MSAFSETIRPPRGRDGKQSAQIHYASPVLPALVAGMHPEWDACWKSIEEQLDDNWELVNHETLEKDKLFRAYDVGGNTVFRGPGDALNNYVSGT